MIHDPAIEQLCKQLQHQYHPQEILVFHRKDSGSGSLSSFKVCMVVETSDVLQLERDVYLNVECEVPFDILIYTPSEWATRCQEKDSFAAHIKRNGVVYCEKK